MKLFNKIIKFANPRYREIFLYLIIGSISAFTDFSLYYLLTKHSDINYLIINFFTVLIGISLSFILNRKYNFKVRDHIVKRFIIFFSVGLVGLLVSSIILYFFVEYLFINIFLSKFLSIFLVVALQFILNKFVTFKNNL